MARSNPKLADDMVRAGYRVFEAQAVSDALYLCESEGVDVMVVAPDVEDLDVTEVQMRRITIRLTPEATAKELIWELSQLFPGKTTTVH